MIWTALIPLKGAGQRKVRLAGRLSADERDALAERMLAHVRAELVEVPDIARLVLLSPARPPDWTDDLIVDHGRGLNAELDAARAALAHGPLLVIHADLPLLAAADVVDLLALAGERGAAVAPDRHEAGTNAVVLADDRAWTFAFGPDSFASHGRGDVSVLRRDGLAFDLDTEADLDRLTALGV